MLVTNALFDSKTQTLSLSSLDLKLNATGEPFPNGAFAMQMSSDIDGNINTQDYALRNTVIKISGTGDAFPEGNLDAVLETAINANL